MESDSHMVRQRAYVFCNTEMGKESECMERLMSVEGVVETCMVYGVYDLVSVVDVKDVEDIRTTVIDQIRKIDGIQSTMTLLVASKIPESGE